eukprot:c35985_g1_i1 orf=86-244(+)
MNVEAYASKMLCMRQRVEDTLNPYIIKLLAKWFIDGLEPVCHVVVNTRNEEI